MPIIRDARILILTANGFEQSELMVPHDELRKAGAKVEEGRHAQRRAV
jgi:protease I